MDDFINTVDVLGDDVVMDSIIDRSITEFKDDALTEIGGNAFRGCAALTTVDLPNAITVGGTAFANCDALTDINLPRLTYLEPQTFFQSKGLVRITLPSVTGNGYQPFNGCTSLEYIDMASKSFNGFGDPNWIGGVSTLKYLIIRSETLCAFHANVLKANSELYVYVPSALLEAYKTYSADYITYADRFLAIEDWSVDGTVTGELVTECRGISLDTTEIVFTEAGSRTLTATTTPAKIAGSYVTWTSDNCFVATVNNGVVAANGDGTAIITATCGNCVATCTVIVSGVGESTIPTLYTLPETTTFNGTSDYIDTGIQLFNTRKDFTIVVSATFDSFSSSECLLHCMNENSPYPGISIDGNNGLRICYTGSSSLTTTLGAVANVSAIALRYVAGVLDAIMYKNSNDKIVSVTIAGSPTYVKVTQNLLLGAYQTTNGTKGRYFSGTINNFDIYDVAIDDSNMATLLANC